MLTMKQKIDKYLIYDTQIYKETFRAIICHIIEDDNNCILKSVYSTYVNLNTKDTYCTCMGFQMRKIPCAHLQFLFASDVYKRTCKEWLK